jgi:hypothetical protein
MCYMAAHKSAQSYIAHEFENAANELSEAAKIVINESQEQWLLAEAVLHKYKHEDVQIVTSHKFCTILLNSGQHYVSKLVQHGLLKDDEAEHWVKEIEHHLEHVLGCSEKGHPGELTINLIDPHKCLEVEAACGDTVKEGEEVHADDLESLLEDAIDIIARKT